MLATRARLVCNPPSVSTSGTVNRGLGGGVPSSPQVAIGTDAEALDFIVVCACHCIPRYLDLWDLALSVASTALTPVGAVSVFPSVSDSGAVNRTGRPSSRRARGSSRSYCRSALCGGRRSRR